jgi:hypothetical protein
MGKFVDNTGAIRHAMSKAELSDLYKRLENFIADLTPGEVERNQREIKGVLSLIHQRMKEK